MRSFKVCVITVKKSKDIHLEKHSSEETNPI